MGRSFRRTSGMRPGMTVGNQIAQGNMNNFNNSNVVQNFYCRSFSKDDTLEGRPEELRSLAAFYERYSRWTTPAPWDKATPEYSSDDVYVSCRVQELDSTGKPNGGDPPKKIKQLFEHGETRILVQGDPGYGKTFMCNKIAHNWARHNKTFTGFVPNMAVVVYYKLKYMPAGAELEEELIKLVLQIKDEQKFSWDDTEVLKIKELLEYFGRQVVVVLDGLDEFSEEHKVQVTELLKARTSSTFKAASIIVTSRPNVDKEMWQLFQKHFQLKGLTEKSTRKLVERYFRGSADKTAFHKVILKHFDPEELSPLLVTMLCYCRDRRDLHIDRQTVNEMYRQLVFVIAKRNCEREELDLNDAQIRDLLNKVGGYFLECMRKENSVFNQEDLDQKLGENSRFAKTCGLLKGVGGNRFEPMHAILMESVVASHVENTLSQLPAEEEVRRIMTTKKVKCLNIYYYKHEDGGDVLTLRFDYRQFGLVYTISSGGINCSVLINALVESPSIPKKPLSVRFKIPLKAAIKNRVSDDLGRLFPRCKSEISWFLTLDFLNVSVWLCLDSTAEKNEFFSGLGARDDRLLPSFIARSDELELTFLKETCSADDVSMVVNRLFNTDIQGSDFDTSLEVAEVSKKIGSSGSSLEFAFAKVCSAKATAKVIPAETIVRKRSNSFLGFFRSPDFSWKSCERIELIFKKKREEEAFGQTSAHNTVESI